ncbi:MAG: type II toxin-antitoxin system RelE/ParE family toxin [Candidatus Binatia bacterium]
MATNRLDRWFFVFGFGKNDRDNISAKELSALKTLAADLLRLGLAQIATAVAARTLQEICHEN